MVEVLVVLAIIMVLMAVAVPALQYAREASRRTQCASNERQFGVAFQNYESSKKAYPSSLTLGILGSRNDPKLHVFNFVSELLPYIEEGGIDAQYHRDMVFCDPANLVAISSSIGIALCPSAPTRGEPPFTSFAPSQLFPQGAASDPWLTGILAAADKKFTRSFRGPPIDYSVPFDADGLFPSPLADLNPQALQAYMAALNDMGRVEFKIHLRPADVRDGLAHTLMAAEAAGRPQHWALGRRTDGGAPLPSAWSDPRIGLRNAKGSGGCFPECSNDGGIYSFHSNGANILYADGHVEFLVADNGAGPPIKALVTIAERDN